MTLSPDERFHVQGWAVSALVHGLALTVVLGLMAQVKPAPKEAFRWDVTLVEPERLHDTLQAEITPTREPAKTTPRPAAPALSQPHLVTHAVQTREVTPVVQREIRQVVEASQPIQQSVAVQTRTEELTPLREQQSREVQQASQAVVESIAPVVQHEAVTAVPAITAAQEPPTVTKPVTAESSIHSVEARVVETASVTHAPDLPLTPVSATTAASDAKPTEPVAQQESAPPVAMATRPAPAVKADYGWLAESLRRRLAEVKRYPSAARLNGWEGKVVLRAVIRADGHLSEVKVHRSSGHEALDNAAIETIRLVCPLHMTNAMSAAEVAVYVPIVYSLGS